MCDSDPAVFVHIIIEACAFLSVTSLKYSSAFTCRHLFGALLKQTTRWRGELGLSWPRAIVCPLLASRVAVRGVKCSLLHQVVFVVIPAPWAAIGLAVWLTGCHPSSSVWGRGFPCSLQYKLFGHMQASPWCFPLQSWLKVSEVSSWELTVTVTLLLPRLDRTGLFFQTKADTYIVHHDNR